MKASDFTIAIYHQFTSQCPTAHTPKDSKDVPAYTPNLLELKESFLVSSLNAMPAPNPEIEKSMGDAYCPRFN